LEGRANLLIRLSSALNNHEIFGVDARPGNLIGRTHNIVILNMANTYQITFFLILPPKPPQSQLSHFQLSGPC
jgi:hypothetical protein